MAANGNVPLELEIGDRNECPVAATTQLFRGSCVFADAAGRATGTLGPIFLGHAAAPADNRLGGAGAINVLLHAGRYRAQVALTGVALTDIGKEVFASDNNTLTLTPGANTLVGRVMRYVDTNLAVVEFAPVVNSTVVTVAQQAHIADAIANYTTGGLDTEAKLITAINAQGAKINAILASDEAAGVRASS
jgi:hypothetical protein